MFHGLPFLAWANGNLAEQAVQLGKMAERPNLKQPTQVREQMDLAVCM